MRDDFSWSVATLAPGLEDRRVEITGPCDRKMTINALNSGAKCLDGRLRGLLDAQLAQRHRLPGEPARRHRAAHRLHQPAGQGVPAQGRVDHRPADDHRAAARLAPRRTARARRRRPRRRVPRGLRPVLLPQRAPAHRTRARTVLLPAEARIAPRGAAVERRVRHGAGPARHAAGDHPRHGAHRDDHRRVRDGGDPLRTAPTTPPGSTPGAGTTSSRSSRTSASAGRASCCPTATR